LPVVSAPFSRRRVSSRRDARTRAWSCV
jgi:hypothetical protein